MRRTIAAGEFQRRAEARELEPAHVDELAEIEARWRSDPTPVAAAELVGASLIAGEPKRAREAAEQLGADRNQLYRLLADRALGREPARAGADSASRELDPTRVAKMFHTKVADAKSRVRRDPRNAVAWSDLARRYTALGQLDQARRALGIARSLAPLSRYLLRAEARFLLQTGRPDQASTLLQRSPRTKDDPWLLAASLSIAAAGRLPITGVRAARRIIERGDFRAIELSELQSELATLELEGGADRKARVLFERSLASPTDNSLAQGEWASHRLRTLEVPIEGSEVPFAAEAMSRAAAQGGDWRAALEHSITWLDDQPFDSQAATHASYIAAVGLDDWSTSKLLAELGLRANPSDATLLNNMAYALIEIGELDASVVFLERARLRVGQELERVAVDATAGLLHFRRGDAEEGRRLYFRAIEHARRYGDRDSEAMARAMLLREEVLFGMPDVRASAEAMAPFVGTITDPGAVRCIERAVALALRDETRGR